MSKYKSLAEAISENLQSGDVVAFEGFTHLIPYAAAHEVIRQKISDLTLIRMTPDIIYDQMIGMGLVKKLIFSYAGNPGVGLLRRLRDSIENGWPNKIEIIEHSHSAMANAYEAGASGMPLAVFRGYLGARLKEVNSNIKTIKCPFTGELLAAIPSHQMDLTVIHAQKADKQGNVLIEGIVGVQKEAALAAKRVIVTVEKIVDDLNAHPNAVILPHWTITAVCHVVGGAHPSYAHGYYGRDNAAYLDWDKISADRDMFVKWMDINVINSSPDDFENRISNLKVLT